MIEVGAAAVAVPEHLELLVMFDEKPVDCDVVAIDDQAVGAHVLVPANTGAVIGTPYPCVIDDRVVAVDFEIANRAADSDAAVTEEEIVERDWFFDMANVATLRAHLNQDGRLNGAGVEEQTGDNDAVGIGCGQGSVAVDGTESGEADAHDDSVGTSDADGLCEVVETGSDEEILAARQLRVEGGSGVSGVGDEELAYGDRFSQGRATVPGDSGRIGSHCRNAHAVVACGIHLKEWLFADNRRLGHLCVGWRGPLPRRWILDAHEDHVPVGAGPTAPLAIARNPLLLRSGVDVAVNDRVRHPSPAGPAVLLVEHQVAKHVHAAEGYGLRDGPLHSAAGRRNREPFGGAPERASGVIAGQAGVRVDVAGNVNGIGRGPDADHFRVEADGHVHVVLAGEEEQCVARRAEFAVLLNGVDLVDLPLDFGNRHQGIEDEDVWPEIRLCGGGCHGWRRGGRQQGQHHNEPNGRCEIRNSTPEHTRRF